MPESRLPAASTPAAEVASILAQCAPCAPRNVLCVQSFDANELLPLAQNGAGAVLLREAGHVAVLHVAVGDGLRAAGGEGARALRAVDRDLVFVGAAGEDARGRIGTVGRMLRVGAVRPFGRRGGLPT